MEFLGSIVLAPIAEYLKYHKSVNENMNNLKRKLVELNGRKEDTESKMSAEFHLGKKPKKEVEIWLENVERINGEIQTIEQEVRQEKYFSRARLGKSADMKIQEVEELYQKGSFADGLLVDAPPSVGVIFPATILAGETTIKKNMEEIWACLMNDEVRKIGVYGMGGVGKTTVMKYINNKLLEKTNKFDNVIWITVSQAHNVIKLQKDIARKLKKNISEHEDEASTAASLFAMLGAEKRYLLILDDMWKAFSLEDVGIPEPTTTNGCKLVLTTRSLDVCRQMGCKAINVQCLSKEEAWKLFLEKVHLDVSRDKKLEATVKLVAQECAGLPLAIVTIACSMRGVYDIRVWKNALNELGGRVKGLKGREKEIFGRLEFSYSRLEFSVQHCFLYCALYPEDFEIEKKMLIEYWVAEGLIETMDSMQDEFDRGHVIINTLVDSCLLQSTNYEEKVKMHDLIRDMALNITRGSPRFMVKAGMQLRELPNEQDWTEDLEKASLMENSISEIASNMSPKCPRLSTLILLHNFPLMRISDSFFKHMHALRVLDLSYTSIKNLPNSISDLENLTALLLRGCKELSFVPSLAKLRALRKLDLRHTRIKQVPDSMEMLVNLRWLDLSVPCLEMLPAGILPKLSRLQFLALYWASDKIAVRVEELVSLRQLETIACGFSDLRDFNMYVRSLPYTGLKLSNYILHIRPDNWFLYAETDKEVMLRECSLNREGEDPLVLPSNIQTLEVEKCHFVSSCLWDLLSSARELKSCRIRNSHGIECVLSSSSLEVKEEESCSIPLQSLEELILDDLPDLSALFKEGGGVAPPRGTLSNLKRLEIDGCSKIKKLFTPMFLHHLHNLEVIAVLNCNQLEEIIAEEEGGEGRTGEGINPYSSIDYNNEIPLPKLKSLKLLKLPELKSICRGKMVCDSIQMIGVGRCPKLRRLPLSLPLIDGQLSPHPSLKNIWEKDHYKWWESLEWDHPNAKNVLQPCVHEW